MGSESPSETVTIEWKSYGYAEDAEGTPLSEPGDKGVMTRGRADDYARLGNLQITGDASDDLEGTPGDAPPADRLQADEATILEEPAPDETSDDGEPVDDKE